jgi:ankyrin repeat protein
VHHLGIAYWSTTEAGFCVCIMSFFKSNDGTKLIKNYWKINKVRVLLRRGANVNAKNEHGDTALILASSRGYVGVVRALLNHDGVDVNIQGCDGDTALIGATRNGHSHVVCDLLNHDGVDVNIKDCAGYTALIEACISGHLEVVRALLNHKGVDVNIENNHGYTALIMACSCGHLEVVCALLNHKGVDVNIKNNYGETALICAIKHNIFNGQDIFRTMMNVEGERSRLRGRRSEVVRALLYHDGVDVNAIDKDGETALILASDRGYLDMVSALLNHKGVDVNIKNNLGESALDRARTKKEDNIARILMKHMEREKHGQEEGQKRPEDAERAQATEKELRKRCDEAERIQDLEEELEKRRVDEEQNCLKDAEQKQAMEEKRVRHELLKRKPARFGAQHPLASDPPRQDERSPSRDDSKIKQDQRALLHVMNTTPADPVEL